MINNSCVLPNFISMTRIVGMYSTVYLIDLNVVQITCALRRFKVYFNGLEIRCLLVWGVKKIH